MIIVQNDWDVMVLHYLGLDHIGHIQGNRSCSFILISVNLKSPVNIIYDLNLTIKQHL